MDAVCLKQKYTMCKKMKKKDIFREKSNFSSAKLYIVILMAEDTQYFVVGQTDRRVFQYFMFSLFMSCQTQLVYHAIC